MRSILLLVAVLAVAGLGWLFFSSSSTDEPLPPAVEPAAKAPAVSVPDAAAGVVAADAATNAASQTPATNPVRTDVTGTETAAAAVVVRGRLVDSAGAPRAGIALGWRSWRSGDFEMEFAASETVGRGREALDGTSTTGADGRFSFALPKGRSGRVTLTTSELLLRRGHGRFSTERGDADLGDVVALRPAVVRGVVTDDKGQPQEGVTVGADTTRLGIGLEHEVKTDALGAFAMAGLQEGVWHLRTLSPRFLPATLEVQLKDEEQKDGVAIQLLRGNAIAGQVVDDRGLPVAGAKVGCMRREKSGAMTIARFAEDEATTTDGNGWFTLAGLSGDTATVRATHRQHDRAMADDVVVGTGNLVLRLSRLATIRGVLKDATGKPLAGSIVSARRAAESGPVLAEHGDSASGALMSDFDVDFDLGEVAEGELEQMARTRPGQALTAKDGSFEIDTVRPGPVNVRARGKAHRPTERKGLNVAPAQVLEGIQLVADVGAVAVVHVVDEKGEPVAGAEVVLARPAERQDGAMMVRSEMRVGSDAGDAVHIAGMGDEFGKAKTDEQGLARIAGLPAGAAEARGSHERFAPSSPVNTTLPQHGEVEVKVVLRTPGSARLSTTDTNGVGIAADYVVRGPLGEPGTDDRRGTTGGDGIGKVEQLAPGRYHAELRKKSRGQAFGDSGSMVFMAADSDQGMRSSRVEFEVTAGGVADVSLRVPTMATVRGRVTGTSGPVANVRVGLSKRSEPDAPGAHGMAEIPGFGEESGSTNAAGDYELRDLEPGRYRLTWGMADQLVKEHQDLEIRPGETEVVRDLALRFGSMRLVVVDDRGEPIEGAEVELQEAASDGAPQPRRQRMMMVTMNVSGDGDGGASTSSMTLDSHRATSDVDGEVEIENVPPGRYTLRITHDRHAKKDVPDQTVIENAVTDCGRVTMQAAGRIRGRVLTADGKPARMAMVTCRKAGDAAAEPDRQPAMGGGFTFQGLAAGRYVLTAEELGPQRSEPGPAVEVEVEGGKIKGDVELRLPAR